MLILLRKASAMAFEDHTVLILEDEYLIGEDIQGLIRSMGCRSLLLTKVGEAISLIEDGLITFAILDHLISGRSTEPVADILRRRRIPFVVCSASKLSNLEPAFQGAPLIEKPYESELFSRTVKLAMAGSEAL